MKLKFNINRFQLQNIAIILVVYIIISRLSNNITDVKQNIYIIAWITNICYIYCVLTIYRIKRNIFDFCIVLISFIFLFCNGQPLLFSLSVKPESLSVFSLSSEKEILNAQIYFCYSMLFFFQGVLFVLPYEKQKFEDINVVDTKFNKAIKIISIILVLITSIFYFSDLINKLSGSIKYGYEYLYEHSNNKNGILLYLSKVFVPSMLLLLYSVRGKKNIRNAIIIFLLLVVLGNLIIGARGAALSIVVILIIFYSIYIKKIKGKYLIILTGLLIVLMILVPTIYNFRSKSNKDLSSFIEVATDITTDNKDNFIVKTISELGYTMHSYILTYNLIPSRIGYKYGESYAASILMLIPSNLLGGYSFAEKAALDTWLQNEYNMGYGPGFSIIAETYYNFGWYGGIMFAAILGMFYAYVLNLRSINKNKNEILRILSLIFLYNSLLAARFPFHSTIRNVVYMYALIYLFIILINNSIIRKDKITE